MGKKVYLDYVRKLLQRETNKERVVGITLWGLFIAIIYLLWNTFPHYVSIKDDKQVLSLTMHLFSYIHFTILFALIIFASSFRNDSSSIFAARLLRMSSNNAHILVLILFVTLAIPIVTPYLFEDLKVSSFHNVQKNINTIIFSLFIVTGLVLEFANYYLERNIGYPSPLSLLPYRESTPWHAIISFLIIIAAFIGNVYCVLFILNEMPADRANDVFNCSLNFSLLLLAIASLFRMKFGQDRRDKLIALERDIIFHNLDIRHIGSRIKEDFIGYELEEWLNERMRDMKSRANQLAQKCSEIEEFKKRYSEIDPAMRYEKLGQLDRFIKEFDENTKNFTEEAKRFADWLSFLTWLRGRSDRVTAVIDNALKDLRDMVGAVIEQHKGPSAEIKEMQKKLKDEFASSPT